MSINCEFVGHCTKLKKNSWNLQALEDKATSLSRNFGQPNTT